MIFTSNDMADPDFRLVLHGFLEVNGIHTIASFQNGFG
jgi:hypothetical protein